MTKFVSALVFSVLLFGSTAIAQKNTEEIKILTSAQCDQCKTRIETAMAFEKGIVKTDLDVNSKVLTVTYKPSKTTPDKIRKAINEVGYDADNTLANPEAYSKLPACCKKPDDPSHVNH
jgi:copper chaperone CopZ